MLTWIWTIHLIFGFIFSVNNLYDDGQTNSRHDKLHAS